MRTPRVSVWIDTYNYGRCVEEAIESVLAQDFPEAERETLVVDDGSTDDTEERLRKYEGTIMYLRKTNGGQASAFNYGLERARGEIVAFLDADDYWLPGKLTRLAEEFARHPDAGMVYHQIRHRYEKEGRLEDGTAPLVSGFLPANTADLLRYECLPTSFLAFRRSVLKLLLPIPEELKIMADAHLSRLVVFLAPIVSVPECLAVYRLHGNNLFWSSGSMDRAREEVRARATIALARGGREWLWQRGYDLHRLDLRMLFRQWELEAEKAGFAAANPGNARFCWHLIQSARYFGARRTWRHSTVAYVNAVGSLALGYKSAHKLDEWRVAMKSTLRESIRSGRGKLPV
jgi:glycosyltransferase involved in cell wall biosynthesis